ncbi:MAG: MarR family transcriptional regulator [Thermoplasmata archaeon]|nr:MarR family transcriptional regulator [Thermoplasmata archaeon]
MADIEYGEEFAVMLTVDGRICVLTNGLSITILRMLMKGDTTLMKVLDATGVAKSTGKSNLSSLVSRGLITTRRSETDKRVLYYSLTSYLLFGSDDIPQIPDEVIDEVVLDLASENPKRTADGTVLFCDAMGRYGINVYTASYRLGVIVGHFIFSQGHRIAESFRDALLARLGIDVDAAILRMDDDALEVSFSRRDTPPIAFLLSLGSVLGALNVYSLKTRDFCYARVFDMEWESNDHGVMRASRFQGEVPDEMEYSGGPADGAALSMDGPFAVYRIGDRTLVVDNDTMMGILDDIEKAPNTIPRIADATGILTITVSVSMKKLVDAGFVQGDGARSNVKYTSLGHRVINGVPVDFRGSTPFDEILTAAESPDYAYSVFEYLACAMRAVGVDFDGTLYDTGKNVGARLVRLNPGITPEEFLRKIPRMMCLNDFEVGLRSSNPMVFAVGNVKNAFAGPGQMGALHSYITGMVHGGLGSLTGERPTVKFGTFWHHNS